MNKKIIIAGFIYIFTIVLFYGCANTISNPVGAGNGTINISVYKPVVNDTINYKGQDVIYDVTIDQGFKLLELYINGKFIKNFMPNASGSKPAVRMELDSTSMNTRINYQLKYYDADGKFIEGPIVSNILVLDDRLPPSVPFGMSLLKISSSSYNISWKDTSHGQIPHEVWRKSNSETDFSLNILIPPGTNNVNDENMDPNQIYYYKVRGLNNYGYSGFSDIINNIGVGGSVNLPAPKLLSAVAVNTTVVKLTWQIYSTAQNYFKVERKSNNALYSLIGVVSKNSNTFTDSLSGLVAGGQYFYRIKAISGSDSSWSNELSVTTPLLIIPVPQITSISNPSASKVTINYNVNNDPWVDYCLIERKTGNGGIWGQIDKVATWISSYDDITVVSGNTYFYRIRKYSIGTQLFSDYSNEMSIYVSLK
jgi:hypothetical protein